MKPSYLLLEPVRYTLAEIVRLCRRPMVLPGPLVRSMLQDLLGAVALCHDRNIVIKSLDAEKVRRRRSAFALFGLFLRVADRVCYESREYMMTSLNEHQSNNR